MDATAWRFRLDCYALLSRLFQCPTNVRRLVANLAEAAKPDAEWLLADFQIPPSGLCRYRAQLIHILMYAFFVRLPSFRRVS